MNDNYRALQDAIDQMRANLGPTVPREAVDLLLRAVEALIPKSEDQKFDEDLDEFLKSPGALEKTSADFKKFRDDRKR